MRAAVFSQPGPEGAGADGAFPMIFNINELMVFGLPIIFNPVMLVPFLAVPLLNYSVAYGFTLLGLVPRITSEVAWTTPILLGGFSATGSVMGSLLQLVNVILGVGIYTPFVRILDRQALHELGCDCYQGYLYSPAVFLTQK